MSGRYGQSVAGIPTHGTRINMKEVGHVYGGPAAKLPAVNPDMLSAREFGAKCSAEHMVEYSAKHTEELKELDALKQKELEKLLGEMEVPYSQSFTLHEKAIPLGFPDSKTLHEAIEDLSEILKAASIGFGRFGVRGSSVTGKSNKAGTGEGGFFRLHAQTKKGASDIDLFFELDDDIAGLTVSTQQPGFIHPDKLTKKVKGLKEWSKKWTQKLGREVTPGAFKIGDYDQDAFTEKNTMYFN